MRRFMGYQRTYCDCPLCAMNCQFIPGYLMPTDLLRISTFHGINLNPLLDWQNQKVNLRQFVAESLLASPGALVLKNGRPCGIPTLVPARNDNDWCKFFDGSLCNIHPVAPFGCAFFDAHQDPRVSNAISAAGLGIIARLWEAGHSLYCQIWNDLHRQGRRAPSPEQCRNRLRTRKGENQAGFEESSRKETLP